jgi:hypothetical protein
MHQEKLLAEIPPDYINWITKENIAASKPNPKKALTKFPCVKKTPKEEDCTKF